MMRNLSQDLRFATRQLFKNKTFTIISVMTVALAVGANTAIFSVVHTVLIASLPYQQVDRLAMVWGRNTVAGLLTALLVMQFASVVLYGVTPRDPLTLTTALFVLTVVAGIACYIPARRASRVDPIVALRNE